MDYTFFFHDLTKKELKKLYVQLFLLILYIYIYIIYYKYIYIIYIYFLLFLTNVLLL